MYSPLDSSSSQMLQRLRATVAALGILLVVCAGIAAVGYIGSGQNATVAVSNAANDVPAVTKAADNKDNEITPVLKNWINWTLSAIDKTVNPCEDFYQFTCGKWLDTYQLPADFHEWWMKENYIEDENRKVVESAMKDQWPIISDFYDACMNETQVDVLGLKPLLPWFEKIASATTVEDLMLLGGEMEQIRASAFFSTYVQADPDDPKQYVLTFAAGGFGLPDISLYEVDEVVNEYGNHIRKLFELLARDGGPELLAKLGISSMADASEQALQFEGELVKLLNAHDEPDRKRHSLNRLETPYQAFLRKAGVSSKKAAKRDGSNGEFIDFYKKFDSKTLSAMVPNVPLPQYFAGLGNPSPNPIMAIATEYLKMLDAYIAAGNMSVPDGKAYLLFQVIHGMVDMLPADYVQENYNFYEAYLYGLQKPIARRFKCLMGADADMGMLTGHYFARFKFSPAAKQDATLLVDNLKAAFRDHLPYVSWMDEEARTLATRKVDMMDRIVGYPDQWPSFTGLDMAPGDFFTSTVNMRKFGYVHGIKRVGEPVNRFDWLMTPPTVNAYYDHGLNLMVLPCGQAQEPDYHIDYPDSANYGHVGRIMAHEVTHGFDSEGFQHDWTGRKRTWMPEKVMQEFHKRTKCVEHLYDKQEAEPGHFVNGKLTSGENIADIGGIKVSYWAYQKLVESKFGPGATKRPSVIPEYTDEQLFFISFGQAYCKAITRESALMQLTTNVHAPSKFRVNVPIQMFSRFGEAFSCKVGSPMHPKPEEVCDMWWAPDLK